MKGQFNDSPAYVVDKYGQREMRSGRNLHESDCLYRTHNGKCDCALGTTINDAATRMRDRCVQKVKAALADEQRKWPNGVATTDYELGQRAAFTYAISALQSLTLEQGEQNTNV